MARLMKISKGGQLTIPAAVRKRWGTTDVRLIDEGERLIVEPAPDEAWLQAVENASGALAHYLPPGYDVRAARDKYKREERELEARKERQKYGPR